MPVEQPVISTACEIRFVMRFPLVFESPDPLFLGPSPWRGGSDVHPPACVHLRLADRWPRQLSGGGAGTDSCPGSLLPRGASARHRPLRHGIARRDPARSRRASGSAGTLLD